MKVFIFIALFSLFASVLPATLFADQIVTSYDQIEKLVYDRQKELKDHACLSKPYEKFVTSPSYLTLLGLRYKLELAVQETQENSASYRHYQVHMVSEDRSEVKTFLSEVACAMKSKEASQYMQFSTFPM